MLHLGTSKFFKQRFLFYHDDMQEQDEFANFEFFVKEETKGIDSEIIEQFNVVYKNMDETKLIEKLEDAGFSFEFGRVSDHHYVVASVPRDLAK